MRAALYYSGLGLLLAFSTPVLFALSVFGDGGYWQKLARNYTIVVAFWRHQASPANQAARSPGVGGTTNQREWKTRGFHRNTDEGEVDMTERAGGVTFKGNPLTVIGEVIKEGEKAPDFQLLANDMSTVSLADSNGKVRLISVVPSLDTPVCDQQTKRFNEEVASLGDGVLCYTISADLPFAQGRWCGAAGCTNVKTLSDHRDMSFGDAYGLHVKELRLLQRAVFVVDEDGVVRYAEYVPEIAQHPDYDKALAAVKEVTA